MRCSSLTQPLFLCIFTNALLVDWFSNPFPWWSRATFVPYLGGDRSHPSCPCLWWWRLSFTAQLPRLKASSLWHTCIPCPGQALLLLFWVVSRRKNWLTNLRVNSPTHGLYWLETLSSLTRLEGFPSHPTLHYRRFFLSNTGESASFNASISLSRKKINCIAKLKLCF